MILNSYFCFCALFPLPHSPRITKELPLIEDGIKEIKKGDAEEAEAISAPAIEARATGIGHRDVCLAKACDARAACLDALDRADEAVELREKAAAIRVDPSSPGPVRLAKEGGKMTDERRLMAAVYLAVVI